ncbi:MAG: rhomboid family intramembrane serine protease [Gammaproteobacteria bacterium]|nr:rhomboid family intramembrane serine protease [Gammaproteobacteria bacterium]
MPHAPSPSTYRVIYRSRDYAACEQRALVLRAVGIEHVLGVAEGAYAVLVPDDRAHEAIEQLRRYEEENAPPRTAPPLVLYGSAWVSTAVYALVLVLIAYCAGEALGTRNWFELGALLPASEARGESWRIVTALTLHADIGHLLGNLAFGGLFGYFAAQLVGPGTAWLSIVIAGALGNWVNSLLMLQGRSTIGASTAVFATLGLVAAYAWRQHSPGTLRWAHRWAPLVAGIALLAFTGAGGERTDVLAHLTGFVSGAVVGLANALPRTRAVLKRIPQLGSGLLALMLVVAAWAWALQVGA